jgi:DNA-binding GntR family transcriptional regulator
MARIKKESLVDQIYQRLKEDIITLKMPLGTRLNVNELQNQLGVSCTPIREAVNRLQQEGLVIYENNVGATVLTLEDHDVQEILELAYTLQTAAVRLAMAGGDREVISWELSEQLNRYETSRTPREAVKAVHDLVGVFYHHCGNRRLDESMIAIQGQVMLLRWIYANCPSSQEDGDIFRKICDGVTCNDQTAICAALEEYTQRCKPAILAWLKEHPQGQKAAQ